jgi:hypothetical protein
MPVIADCTLVDGELDRQFERPAPELSPEARRHLEECQRCRGLHRWIAKPPLPVDISAELTRNIRTALVTSMQPVKPLPSARVFVLRLLGIFLALALGLIAIIGAAALEKMSSWQVLGITVILAAGAALLSVSVAWQMVPGGRQRISLELVSAAFALGFLAGVVLLFPWNESEPLLASGWACLLRGLAMAATGALFFWLLVRRGAPMSATRMGATLGAVAGLLGVTVLQFQCIHQYASHLLVWHGGVLLVSAGVGALLGNAVTRGLTGAK